MLTLNARKQIHSIDINAVQGCLSENENLSHVHQILWTRNIRIYGMGYIWNIVYDCVYIYVHYTYTFSNFLRVLMFDISVDWPKNAKFCTH